MALHVKMLQTKRLFGAYADSQNNLRYTGDSSNWFDLSMISAYGKETADQLKFQNRRAYQELIFEGLGLNFTGEKYLLPKAIKTGIIGGCCHSCG